MTDEPNPLSLGINPVSREDDKATKPEDSNDAPAPLAVQGPNQPPGDSADVEPEEIRESYVNWRLMIASIVIFGVGMVSLWQVNGYQRKRLSGTIRERAQENLAAGKTELAKQQLNDYLKFEPEDRETLIQADTLLWEDTSDGRKLTLAVRSSERLLRKFPDLHDVRRRQIGGLIALDRFDGALDQIEILRETKSEFATSQSLDVLEGFCCYRKLRFEDAVKLLEGVATAASFEPVSLHDGELTQAEVAGLAADIYVRHLDNVEKAIEIAEIAFSQNPESAQLDLLCQKLSLTDRNSDTSDLEKYLSTVRKLVRDGKSEQAIFEVHFLSTWVENFFTGDPQYVKQMIELCEQLAEEETENHLLFQAWASLELLRGQHSAAIAILREGVEKTDKSPILYALLIDELISREKIGEAKRLMNPGKNNPLSKLSAGCRDYLDGRIFFVRQNLPAARDKFEYAEGRLDQQVFIRRQAIYLVQCYQELRDTNQELRQFRKIQDLPSLFLIGMIGEARALDKLGRTEDAAAVFGQIPEGLLLPFEAATFEFRRMDVRPIGKRNWERFEQLLDAAIKKSPSDPQQHVLNAKYLNAQGKSQEAIDVLEFAAERNPEALSLWTNLIQIMIVQNRLEEAEVALKNARKSHSGAIALDANELILLKQLGDKKRLKEKLDDLEADSANWNKQDQITIAQKLIAAWYFSGDSQKALKWQKKLALELMPTRDRLLGLLSLAASTQDDELAEAATGKLRQLEGPDSPYLTFAKLIVEIARIDELARKNVNSASLKNLLNTTRLKLTDLVRENPSENSFLLALARFNEMDGRPNEAIEAYQSAISSRSQSEAVLRRLMSLLNQQQRFEELDKLKDSLHKYSTKSNAIDRLQVEADMFLGDYGNAASGLGELENRSNPLWQANVLIAAGKLAEAEDAYRKAVKEQPANETAWLTLVRFLVVSGRLEEAKETANKAKLSSILGKARLAEMIGDKKVAETLYVENKDVPPISQNQLLLADFYIRNGKNSEAQSVLEGLLKRESDLYLTTKLNTRRLLAQVLSSSGYIKQFQRAISLIDKNIEQSLDNRQDNLIKARLYSKRPHTDNAKQALDVYETYQRSYSLDIIDRLNLIRAHDVLGRFEESKTRINESKRLWKSIASHPRYETNLSKQYIAWHLKNGHLREARKAVFDLDSEVVQSDPEYLRLAAWFDCLEDNPGSAIGRIKEFQSPPVSSDGANQERENRRDVVARILTFLVDKFSHRPNIADPISQFAQKVYADERETTSRMPLNYAELLALSGRGEYAIEELSRVSGEVDEFQRISAAVLVLPKCDLSDSVVQTIESWTENYVQSNSNFKGLALYMQLLVHDGKYQDGIKVCSQLIERSPDNPFLLNNLAWLHFAAGDTQKAVSIVNRAIELAGPASYLLDTRSVCLLEKGMIDSAIRDLEEAFAQNPSDATRYHLAAANYLAGNKARADAYLTELSGKSAKIRRSLAEREWKLFDRMMENR